MIQYYGHQNGKFNDINQFQNGNTSSKMGYIRMKYKTWTLKINTFIYCIYITYRLKIKDRCRDNKKRMNYISIVTSSIHENCSITVIYFMDWLWLII